jgi:hypothetical protein
MALMNTFQITEVVVVAAAFGSSDCVCKHHFRAAGLVAVKQIDRKLSNKLNWKLSNIFKPNMYVQQRVFVEFTSRT